MTALEALNISKDFRGEGAVQQLTLQTLEGEILGLIGPNGAGKSTTMLMLVGLLRPDVGEIRLFGQPLTDRSIAGREDIGWVPQQLAFYAGLSVRENVQFFASLYGLSRLRLEQRTVEVLSTCRLTEYQDRTAHTLSGGLQRRLNLSVALVHSPRVLVLDEPTVGIDFQSRALILESLAEMAAAGCSIVLSSHQLDELVGICHRIGVMDRGRLVRVEEASTLFRAVRPEFEILLSGHDPGLRDQVLRISECNWEPCASGARIRVGPRSLSDSKDWLGGLSDLFRVLRVSGSEIQSLRIRPLEHTGQAPPAQVPSDPSSIPTQWDDYRARSKRSRTLQRAGWLAALILLVALLLQVQFRQKSDRPSPLEVERQSLLSPDAKTLAFRGQDSIWVRSLQADRSRNLAATEGSEGNFFWSPDSRQLAYFKQDSLWKISIDDPTATLICRLPVDTFVAGNWSPDDSIVLTTQTGAFYQVPARGGILRTLSTPTSGAGKDASPGR